MKQLSIAMIGILSLGFMSFLTYSGGFKKVGESLYQASKPVTMDEADTKQFQTILANAYGIKEFKESMTKAFLTYPNKTNKGASTSVIFDKIVTPTVFSYKVFAKLTGSDAGCDEVCQRSVIDKTLTSDAGKQLTAILDKYSLK